MLRGERHAGRVLLKAERGAGRKWRQGGRYLEGLAAPAGLREAVSAVLATCALPSVGFWLPSGL